MNDNAPPSELVEAVSTLWKLKPPQPGNLFSAPAFVVLRETCQRLYPNAGLKVGVDFALSTALRRLGLPCGLASGDTHLVLSVEGVAGRLNQAFHRTHSTRVHLCPLDCCDANLPALKFGPNSVRVIPASELESLVDRMDLKRVNSTWAFDAERFSEFTWLIVQETVQLRGEPGARAVPTLFADLRQDFGAIDPYKGDLPKVVEDALFALMLAPWEEWAAYNEIDWRAFRVPWVYTLSDDIFERLAPPPSPESLSWEPRININAYGEEVEDETPTRLPLIDSASGAAAWLNDSTWIDVLNASVSPLFGRPVGHFLTRAFLADGIDEFLAHITVIEAALGLSIDHDMRKRPKLEGMNNPGATVRVAIRLSALLGTPDAGDEFKRLFKIRSDFIHGAEAPSISSKDRNQARRLARRTVSGLIKASLASSVTECLSRETYLNALLRAEA